VSLNLENNEPLSDELMNHARDCPSCSRLINAHELLTRALSSARTEKAAAATPISTVRARAAMHEQQKEILNMAKFTGLFSNHRRFTFGIAFGLLALIFFVAIPFPYQKIVGYNVALNGVPEEIPTADLSRAMDAIGQGQAPVKVLALETGFNYQVPGLPTEDDAREVGAVIAALSGTDITPQIAPVYETVSASLYAQARERIIKIEVDGKGKTDDQIKAEIESKLAAQGLSPAFVFVKTDSTGQRQIRMEINEKGEGHSGLQSTIEVDSRGKTDAQVAAEIRAKLAEQGHPNANVTIESSGADSLRQIKIEFEDSTSR
jgi:hypothetical protein